MTGGTLHPDWLTPRWPVHHRVRAVFTTRAGGVSRAPFDSFNLGRPSDDDPVSVDTNRQRLQAAIGALPVFLHQVHGVATVELSGSTAPHVVPEPQGDACVTEAPGVACTVRVADCLPLLLADVDGRVVGAAHAGWRGLASGVIENCVDKLLELGARRRGQTLKSDALTVWLGPCIGPREFEVGPEVRVAFTAHDPDAASCFTPLTGGKWLADLPALARMRLLAMGVAQVVGNDGTDPWCTVKNPSLFFSHRRDSRVLGGSGRMAACVWLDS